MWEGFSARRSLGVGGSARNSLFVRGILIPLNALNCDVGTTSTLLQGSRNVVNTSIEHRPMKRDFVIAGGAKPNLVSMIRRVQQVGKIRRVTISSIITEHEAGHLEGFAVRCVYHFGSCQHGCRA